MKEIKFTIKAINEGLLSHIIRSEKKIEANLIKCNNALADAMASEVKTKESMINQDRAIQGLIKRMHEVSEE